MIWIVLISIVVVVGGWIIRDNTEWKERKEKGSRMRKEYYNHELVQKAVELMCDCFKQEANNNDWITNSGKPLPVYRESVIAIGFAVSSLEVGIQYRLNTECVGEYVFNSYNDTELEYMDYGYGEIDSEEKIWAFKYAIGDKFVETFNKKYNNYYSIRCLDTISTADYRGKDKRIYCGGMTFIISGPVAKLKEI